MARDASENWIDITTIGDRYEIQMSSVTSMKRWRLLALPRLVTRTDFTFEYEDYDEPWNYSEVPND